MNGKERCNILRTVRSRIASQNGIAYEPHKCALEGECLGTCPKCEEETEQLTKELRKRYLEGQSIHIDPISIADLIRVEDATLLSFDKEDTTNILDKDDELLGDFD